MRSIRPRHSASYWSRRRRAHGAAPRSRVRTTFRRPMRVLGDQAGPLEHGDVLLNGREAHRVVPGELGDTLRAVERAADDVPPGGVGQGREDEIGFERGLHTIQPYGCMTWLSSGDSLAPRPARGGGHRRRQSRVPRGVARWPARVRSGITPAVHTNEIHRVRQPPPDGGGAARACKRGRGVRRRTAGDRASSVASAELTFRTGEKCSVFGRRRHRPKA